VYLVARLAPVLVAIAVASMVSVAPSSALAQARRGAPKSGIELAREGDCVAAVPLLERAEAEDHRPATAAALARCHVALGELLLAHEIWSNLAGEAPSPRWSAEDRRAHADAGAQAGKLLERIPTLEVEVRPEGLDPRVMLGRRDVDASKVILVPPDERVSLRVIAAGHAPFEKEILLAEGAHLRVLAELRPAKLGPKRREASEGERDDDREDAARDEPRGPRRRAWIGARYRGLIVPGFVMNLVGDGGTTAYLPGGALTLALPLDERLDLVTSLGVQSYAAGPFPFKPHGTPDTEWEIVESDLFALLATAELSWRFPLDDAERFSLRFGGGLGVGVAAFGDLVRTQAYPAGGDPSDPDAYAPCRGPNDPAGTFRYCNQLDKDATRYGEPDRAWGDGGARPLVYPWVAFPELGLEWLPAEGFALQLEVGASISGFIGGAGAKLEL
jgi:hypothetical protein